MVQGKIWIGTSGWNYPHWREGVLYPSGLGQKQWLAHYARHFDTVEINNTFYQLPPAATFRGWEQAVPSSFLFAIKANRFITHVKRLKDPQASVERFFAHLSPLGEKTGPILFQLPPNMKADRERLGEFLGCLDKKKAVRVAFEFRHPSWFVSAVYDLLEKKGVTLCLADWPPLDREVPFLGSFCYLRRHGATALYASCYSDQQLADDAGLINRLAALGKDVYLYFNNDAHGYAVRNALTLRGMLGKSQEKVVVHGGPST